MLVSSLSLHNCCKEPERDRGAVSAFHCKEDIQPECFTGEVNQMMSSRASVPVSTGAMCPSMPLWLKQYFKVGVEKAV